jgi:hypothetical protein
MKAIKLMMMAGMMAFATAASAQVQCLTVDDVAFDEGEGTADLVVDIDYTTDKTIVSWGFTLYLPDGIEIGNELMDEEDPTQGLLWHGSYGKSNASAVQRGDLNVTVKEDGGYLILGYATGNPAMKNTHGNLVNLELIATAQTSGAASIKNTSMAYIGLDGEGKEVAISADQGLLDDVNFTVDASKAQVTVGIKDIKTVDSNAPAYNLQGVRVNANAKGIIIRDGKKMVVK